MPALDISALLTSMLAAAKKELTDKWPSVRDYAANEFAKLLAEAEHIGALRAAGTINDEEAALLMDMQRNASRAVLLTVKGLGLIAAQAAINAALAVVRPAVNTAIGFALL